MLTVSEVQKICSGVKVILDSCLVENFFSNDLAVLNRSNRRVSSAQYETSTLTEDVTHVFNLKMCLFLFLTRFWKFEMQQPSAGLFFVVCY